MEAPMGKAIAWDDSIVWRPEIKIEIIDFNVYQNNCHTSNIKTRKPIDRWDQFVFQTNWFVFTWEGQLERINKKFSFLAKVSGKKNT